MRVVRLRAPGGPEQLALEEEDRPRPAEHEALVRVHAAAITRDELEWPVDRLPAIPSYELSGVVEEVGPGVAGVAAGDEVFALTPFDQDGVACDYAAVRADLLAPRPRALSHAESAATALPALTAWQGLFDHGRLDAGERVLIHGAAGGVGAFAVQLARASGAHVIGTASAASRERVLELGAHEVVDAATRFEDTVEDVDVVFDTVGGERLRRSPAVLRGGGRLVSVAEEPPDAGVFFVVAPDHDQLASIATRADSGELRPPPVVLIASGSWLSSCWAWDRASSTCLSSANRVSLLADRSEIFCFSISPEDFRMPMLLCFSSAKCFTFITSSESWACVALSARR
jgi:NADPH:quinone reductase-like Zn-dependent oxidoreductase